MKKYSVPLFCLTTVLAQGVFADMNDGSMQSNNNCNPCAPCCTPKPKKCIDCECYTPAYYDLQCDWGAYVTVDFLYWYAHETNLSYALEMQAIPTVPSSLTSPLAYGAQSYQNVGSSWSPGVRVGLGWNTGNDGWDTFLSWTWYQVTKKNHVSVPDFGVTGATPYPTVDAYLLANGEVGLDNPFLNPGVPGAQIQTVLFDSISQKWKFNLNSIDLELGRKYWLSREFTARPYVAVRGAWTHTPFNVTSSRTASAVATATFVTQDNFNNKYWGVGLVTGFQPNWYFCRTFVLYGNLDVALIWGQSKATKTENYQETAGTSSQALSTLGPVSFFNKSHNSFSKMTPILDLALGLRWEEEWSCSRYSTALDIGWEHHEWFGLNERSIYTDRFSVAGQTAANSISGFRGFLQQGGNVGFGGLVIRGRLDF